MGRTLGIAAVALFALVLGRDPVRPPAEGAPSAEAHAQEDSTSACIRELLGSALPAVAGQRLRSVADVRLFYEGRGHKAAWLSADGSSRAAGELLGAIADARTHGLDANDYHHGPLRQRMPQSGNGRMAGRSDRERAELDVLLTDAFLTLARHRHSGRIDARVVHSGWTLAPRTTDLLLVMREALEAGSVEGKLRALDPAAHGYAALQAALVHYLATPPWPVVPPGPALKPVQVDARVPLLRHRLAREAHGPAHVDTSTFFDATLESAVRVFQRSHGLEQDGIVGPATRSALAVSAAERARQIALNLERLRWLPHPDARLYIRVDLPAFELRLFERDTVVFRSRIIGGRPDWPTPVFTSAITAITFSPYWNVPPRITALEVLPSIRRDPGYLARNEMRVIDGWGARPRIIDPSTIDWNNVRAATFRYRIRQEPGPQNPLGGVKFILPNPYDVYLHDSPARELFTRPSRAFSHGCMRLERSLELAAVLLRDQPAWTDGAIQEAAHGRTEKTVALPSPVPIHVLYRTAWIDEVHGLQFREDMYGHDDRLTRALARARTGAVVADAVRESCDDDPAS